MKVSEVDFSTLWVEKWLIPNLEFMGNMDVALTKHSVNNRMALCG
ncbi:MAG: hypothetical protein Ta2A_04840 [Treponemataceae bacterium]|nr:MAG: hypothetical protein Ta2A_04840 [Treponemataceae bacterium]